MNGPGNGSSEPPGGYLPPQRQEPGTYPPPQQAGGYPPPPQPGSYPQSPQQPGSYPQSPQQPGGYPPPQQPGSYPQSPQQPGGYPQSPQQPGGYPPPPAGRSNKGVLIAVIAVAVLLVGGLGVFLLANSSSDDKHSAHHTPSPQDSHSNQGSQPGATCPDLSSLLAGAPGNPTLSLHKTDTPPVSIELPAGTASIICAGTISTHSGVTDVAGGKPGSSVVTTFTYPGSSVSSYENQLKAEGWTCSTLRATGCVDPHKQWNVLMVEQGTALVILVAAN